MNAKGIRQLVWLGAMGWTAIWSALADSGGSGANLVRNPGFEEGVEDGNPKFWHQQAEGEAQGTVALAEETAHSGRCSLRIDLQNDKGYLHPIQNLTVASGSYVYRLWARSDADVSCVMQIYDTRSWGGGAKPDDLQVGGVTTREFKLAKDTWQRCEMLVDVTTAFPASLQIGLRQKGRLWLDDLELVPAEPRLVLATSPKPHPEGFLDEELRTRANWTWIRDRAQPVTGDVWLGNEFVGLGFRLGAVSADYFVAMPGGEWRKLSELTPVGPGNDRAKAIRSLKVHELYPDKAVLDVTSETAGGKTLTVRFKLERGRRFVETEARAGVERLVASSASRYAVVPDGFGGDLVIAAAKTSAPRLSLPRERMFLHLVDGGDAILMFTWLSPDQSVTANLAGEGAARTVSSTEIDYRRDQRANVWIAGLVAPAIWQEKPVSELTDMMGNKLARPLPFDAVWRVDFRREQDGLIDSWAPTSQQKGGNWDHCRENGSRTMWTSCRGDVVFPAFVQDGSMYLVNTRFPGAMRDTYYHGDEDLSFAPGEAALVYPFASGDRSPDDAPAVREILRQTLELTPEFQAASQLEPIDMPRHRYPATCAVTGEYEQAFDQGSELKDRRKLIEDLRRMDFFVLTKRERIEEYMTWMRKQQAWLEARRSANPELAALVSRFEGFLARMADTYSKGRGTRMLTPADCQALVDRVEALIDEVPSSAGGGDSSDKLALAQDLGKQTRSIGGAQDSVLGCLRQIVKELRQTAGVAMLAARDESEFALARQLREATVELLWQTCGHEWR